MAVTFIRRNAILRAAYSLAQAEASKAGRRAKIEYAKPRRNRAYTGRKPSFTREQFVRVRAMLGQEGLSNSPQSQHHSPVGQEHGRTIPLAEVAARRMCGSSLQANAAKLKKSSA